MTFPVGIWFTGEILRATINGTGAATMVMEGTNPIDPDAVDDLLLWWDFSESAGNYCFSNLAGTTAVSDGSRIRNVASRFGTADGLPYDNDDAYAGYWDANVRNGNGAFNTDRSLVSGNSANLEHAVGLGTTNPCTVIVVAETPTVDGSDFRGLFGGNQPRTAEVRILASSGGGLAQSRHMTNNPSNQQTSKTGGNSWSLRAGNWYMWLFESEDDQSNLTINNIEFDPSMLNTTALVPNNTTMTTFRVGTASQPYFVSPTRGWDAYIGEALLYDRLLSSDEKTGLFAFFQNKWSLTADFP